MADLPSEPIVYLHGDLDLKILKARRLPNMDMVSEHFRRCFTACHVSRDSPDESGKGRSDDQRVKHHGKIITSDPYVTVNVPQATVARTRVLSNSQEPEWNEQFVIPLAHPVVNFEFSVKDNDVFGAQTIGTVKIPASSVATGELLSGWFPITGPDGRPPKPDSALRLEMRFTPCEKNSLYSRGIAGDPEHLGVRSTYFPLRKGGSVTLYKDAHASGGFLPEIELDGGKVFAHGKCWEDICHAISEAHHMIYIVGWSVFQKVRLIREPTRPLPRGGDLLLGDLLKYKSEEGVRVLLLVWDDKTSHSKFINTEGVMHTHDEETRKFFKHSSVICVLSPRYASSKLSYMKQKVIGTLFTHHQKCVLVDTQAFGNNRKITAFIGGLDLCDGRYDTPEHRLFQGLETAFKDDFHNITYPAGTRTPRQPWHDLHCKIEGPAAYDVLVNFEQRWLKARKWKEISLRLKRGRGRDDSLLRIGRISWILSPPISSKDGRFTAVPKDDPSLWVSREDSSETWHVQIFRSIDSGSVKGFPKDAKLAQAQNLDSSKDLAIDKSIQTAYIQAIRSAKHFIYIENQYFIGSSYAWPSYKNAGADNLVPMELALKIASKIRAKERFAVYVVIPMWPEGDPKNDVAIQEILYWQSQTMETMYKIVAEEIKSSQPDLRPSDFLNFYCVGNREETSDDTPGSQPSNTVSDSQKFKRFAIYVHSKGMIVDDEYLILGSANINQRSLAGTKDTEIAMGSYQPHHSWSKLQRHPHGQIYGYRMALWAEHLGLIDEWMEEAGGLKCVRQVNEIAEDNWKRFTADEFTLLQGHLLKYPLQVDEDGKVSLLPGSETFPDVGGKVIGAPSIQRPDVLTT